MASKKGYDFKKTLVSTTGLLVLFFILILVNVLFSYASIRWDATEDKIYSLSQGTKKILSGLAESVTIKFFYSRSNRDLSTNIKLYAKRVREFLSEYEHASSGRLKVEEYDPKVDSDEEEWAQKYGIRAMQTPAGDKIYCGLVLLAADQEETIEFLDPTREELLEYDITRIIHRLQSPEKKVVGVISTLPVFGGMEGSPAPFQPSNRTPWLFVQEMKKSYEVRKIDLSTDRIEPSIDLLLILHPRDLSAKLQYAVDQYVLSGRNVLIFVDPFCISDTSQGRQQFMRPPGSTLEKLFSAWGIVMEPAKALADFDQPTRVRTRNNMVENNPVWISARGPALSKEDVITSRLESMLFPIAGAIKKTEGSDCEFEPMVQSGENSALIDVIMANFGASAIRRDFVPAGERFTIAARVRGKFKTAFPAGPPKDEKAKSNNNPEKDHLKTAKERATLIIVADADMMADEFYVQRSRILGFAISKVFNDNLNFLFNATEILTGSADLIGIRSRGKFERPFTTVLKLERRARERWLSKEKELAKQAENTNRKLRELEQQKDASQRLIISPEQEAEITKFREQKLRINRELKQVRKSLRADIEALGTTLRNINVFLMPFFVSLGGIGFAIYKQRRMKRR
ncbi:MAG: GldG family protein [Desulfobacteraceae bacterium]|nr:MAG: GldG family protein [Desulfobacteraceae bacterium]